jgi:cytochrome c peroxidase
LVSLDFDDRFITGLGGVDARVCARCAKRCAGAWLVRNDEFNCLSRYSDAPPESCAELRFMVAAGTELTGAFKPPSLRNVAQTGPYMHAGQFTTLREVLEHYNRAPAAPVGRTELKPLQLSAVELAQLEAFLRSLSGAIAFQ